MQIPPESIYTVLITLITVFGSTQAWKFYEKKINIRKTDGDTLRKDYLKRIEKLENLLEKSSTEKDEMRDKILQLTKDLAELTIKVKFLEMENRRLLELNSEILSKQK